MKKLLLIFSIILIAFPEHGCFAQSPKGHIVIIGGGKRPDYVMKKIVELAGGENAKMIVIPNASSERLETAQRQSKELMGLGAVSSDYVIFSKETADADSNLRKLENITGVFFSGGDQSNLTRDLLGTKLLNRIYEIYNSGGVISGTSAGAAVMSEVMITGNELINPDSSNAFISIRKNNIETTKGFGFIKSAIIDQHFIKRKRHNRLISLIIENPELPGIAIDEETSIVVYPDHTFEVLGESQVLILDAGNAKNIRTDKNGNLRADDIKLHLLINGDRYNLKTKKVVE
ncbi:MAG: cyanophycinase [Ignavibacterium sp.]|nr:cyanophycinase [Ignavibacterium sp.]